MALELLDILKLACPALLIARITLEAPAQYLQWLRAGQAVEALRRQERKAATPRGLRRR